MHDRHPAPRSPAAWLVRALAALTAGYAAVLLWATHHPKPQDLLGEHPPSDKLLHVGAYAVLGVLGAATLAAAGRSSPRDGLTALAALATFAAIDEVTQPLPWFGRTADLLDWVYDVVGLVAGAVAVAACVAIARRLRRP